MLEFAIVLSLLCVIVFGMIDLGLMLKDSLSLSNLAKSAARDYALAPSDSVASSEDAIKTRIKGFATTAHLLDASKITFSFVYGPGTGIDAEHVKVTLTYPHKTIAGGLLGLANEIDLAGAGIHHKE